MKTKVIQQDISTATPEDYERIAKEINILEDVGILGIPLIDGGFLI